MSTRYEPPRHRAREVSVLILLLALLTTAGVLATDPFRNPVALTGAAGRWVPADADRAYATIEGTGRTGAGASDPAMVEHARLSPQQAVEAISSTAYETILRRDRWPTQWWRETLFASGWNDPWRNRLRGLDNAGAITRTAQTWGDRGLVFGPGLLELPADVAPGVRWNSTGEVAGNEEFGIGRYRNDSSASAVGDCLLVVSDTALTAEDGTPRRWREENTWCPGRGVVAERGSTDLGPAPLQWSTRPGEVEPLKPDRLIPPQVPLDRLADWTRRPMTGFRGDASFGFERGRDQTMSGAGAVSAGGVAMLRASVTPDVIALEATEQNDQLPVTRLHPGGAILNLTAVGDMIAVSTTDRRVQLYHPGGYQAWTATLPDVSTTGPVRVGTDRIVVATLGGSVHGLDLATGRELWRQQLDAGVTMKPASDGTSVAVADEQQNITVFDAATGAQLWQHDSPIPIRGVAVSRGQLFTNAAGWLRMTRIADEQFVWESAVPTTVTLAVTSTRVVVAGQRETLLLDPADGRRVAALGGADDLLTVDDTAFLVTGDELSAVGPDGQRQGSWPLTPAGNRILQPSDSGIWVLGRDPEWTMDRVGP
ncbi:outer membrane protein assembly factor BamB family protein [Enemella evansiae]|uniref:outer membrane protein assembly factor BamB family protein n=1 Tax=Enemella evansiae TaxID=2016499 RepID=UPI000B975FD3|nr:PQQ-binding-like beta-propeller repeat protein [Enemella evansiae]OYO18291.1 hypothetical protein BI335_07995 [Enemella evansiae]TDO93778.1 putative pyrroloquinoline-quinone binding quinoprotein [Enemella evansiae]